MGGNGGKDGGNGGKWGNVANGMCGCGGLWRDVVEENGTKMTKMGEKWDKIPIFHTPIPPLLFRRSKIFPPVAFVKSAHRTQRRKIGIFVTHRLSPPRRLVRIVACCSVSVIKRSVSVITFVSRWPSWPRPVATPCLCRLPRPRGRRRARRSGDIAARGDPHTFRSVCRQTVLRLWSLHRRNIVRHTNPFELAAPP